MARALNVLQESTLQLVKALVAQAGLLFRTLSARPASVRGSNSVDQTLRFAV